MAAATMTLKRPSALLSILIILSSACVQGQLDEEFVEYSLVEEQPSSTLIGNIVSDSGLDQRYSAQTLQQFRFDFLTQTNVYNQFFVIENSGMLRTSRKIDRDQLCSTSTTCDIQLDIAVKPVDYFQIIKVKIHVLDINDNWPTFEEERVTLSISETTVPEATFAMPLAVDPDSGAYGVQTYQLQHRSGARKFSLRVTNSTEIGGSPTDVHLVLKEKLDREDLSFYGLVLVAYDGGIPRKSGSVNVDVNVMDANDNPPRFDNKTYEVYVYENVAVDMTIAQVHAVDADDGDNGQVIYSFSRSTDTEFGELFGINELSGEVFVKSSLDYEHGGQYVLGLVAQDQGPNALAAYAKLKIHVWDVNDHAPHITVNSLTSTGGAEISEDADRHTFVAHISVQDPDSGRNGEFTCSIDDNHFVLQQLYKTEFKIITAARFDRETQDTYNVNLICQDRGSEPKSSIKPIVISILDENDHPPTFPQDVFYITFRENNTLDDVIFQVNATDADIGTNAEIEYSIMNLGGSYPHSLKIDPVSGIVRASMVFDREENPRYEYLLTASDKGEPSFSATATLSLSIADINDNAPEFDRSVYKFGTFENQVAGTEIGTVLAHDRDGPKYNEVTYTLDYSKGDGAEIFSVDPRSGKITTQRVLDREYKTTYSIVVVARNFGYPLSSSVNVSIDVADKNDNAPIIIYPINDNETIQISSMSDVGDVVSHVEAFDLDFAVNAFLMYEIVAGNNYGLFDINPVEGTILVRKELHNFADHLFKLGVLVSDQGNPPMSAVTELQLYINGSAAPPSGHHGFTGLDDSMVVIIVATLFSLVLVIGIILLILLLRRRQERQRRQGQKYNGRIHGDTMMSPVDGEKGPPGPPLPPAVEVESNGSLRAGSLPKKEVKFSRDDEVIQNRFFENGSWPSGMANPDFMQNPRAHGTNLARASPRGPSPALLPSDAKYPEHVTPRGSPYPRKEMPPPFLDGARHRLYYCGDNKGNEAARGRHHPSPTTPLSELQAQDMLELLPAPSTAGDGGSDRGSLTDSGRGPSEEGDHLQHSPTGDSQILPHTAHRGPSPKSTSPQQNNQPTKFTVYPRSPNKKLKRSSPIPQQRDADNNSLPTKHHGNQWKPLSYNDLRHHDNTNNSAIAKPMVPPRTSSINNHRPPALPPKGPKLLTFSSENIPRANHTTDILPPRSQNPVRCMEEPLGLVAGSRNSIDCVSDDGTTTSGSYVVDLTEVEEADEHMSPDIMV